MSQCTWRVILYGINCGTLTLNEKTKDEGYEYCDSDFLAHLLQNHPYLTWATDGQGEYFIGFTPKYPWELTPEIIKLSTEDVEQEIRRVLEPHVESLDNIEFDHFVLEGWG